MVEDQDELGRLTDVNVATTWSAMGRLSGAAVGGSDECPFMATGIDAAFFNGAYATRAVSDPEQVVRDATEFMAAQGVPWLLWVRTGVDDALLEAGRDAGLTDAGGPPAMALASIPPLPPPPDGLQIRVVDDAEMLEACIDVTARGYEMPVEIARLLVSEGIIADPQFVAVLGFVEDVAVSCALVSVSGTTAGIYNVATPTEHRRRGYGAALTWAAVEQGARLGCDHAVLQSSDVGESVYRAMGFVDVGRYVQLEGPPKSAR